MRLKLRKTTKWQKSYNIAPPKTPPNKSKKNPAAVALGRLGGLRGGQVRAERLTPEQRTAIAKKAAETRWKHIKDAKPREQ
jgi:hypothetical protein